MKTICRKISVNSRGYAYGGTQYFGVDRTLWYVELPDGRTGHVRANSRDEAIVEAELRPEYWGIH